MLVEVGLDKDKRQKTKEEKNAMKARSERADCSRESECGQMMLQRREERR